MIKSNGRKHFLRNSLCGILMLKPVVWHSKRLKPQTMESYKVKTVSISSIRDFGVQYRHPNRLMILMLRDEENIKKIETIMITRICRIYLEQQGNQIFRKNLNLLINTKLSRNLEKSIVCPMKLKQESRIEFKLTSPRELKPNEKWTENECAWEIERGRW